MFYTTSRDFNPLQTLFTLGKFSAQPTMTIFTRITQLVRSVYLFSQITINRLCKIPRQIIQACVTQTAKLFMGSTSFSAINPYFTPSLEMSVSLKSSLQFTRTPAATSLFATVSRLGLAAFDSFQKVLDYLLSTPSRISQGCDNMSLYTATLERRRRGRKRGRRG